MIDESQTSVDPAAVAAPEPDATAAPGIEDAHPEQNQQPGEEAAKTFTQEELDEIVRKRLDKAERKWRREQVQQQPEIPVVEADEDGEYQAPDPKQIIEQYEARKQQQALDEQYEEREEAALERYDDFDQVAKNPNLPVTPSMALAIKASEIGPDILYHLGSEPKEAARIARLPDLLQAQEIGKIEATLTANPPTKKTSTAPAPISPVTAHNKGGPAYDTTDPRSTKTMSTSEWIEADRKRRWRELQAARQ